jgi:mercuric ion transport protein
MDNRTLLKTGIVGTVIAAVCCATPILVILLGALGLSAWAGWLDYVLMPALVIFVGVMIYALRRRRKQPAAMLVSDRTIRDEMSHAGTASLAAHSFREAGVSYAKRMTRRPASNTDQSDRSGPLYPSELKK